VIRKETSVRHLSRWISAGWLVLALSSLGWAQRPPANFVLHQSPKPVGAVAFEDDQGRAQHIADFRGKVVLLNVWATWCGPCREEMPALDRLQAILGGPDFEVVALSIDWKGVDAVRKFYAEVGVRNLPIHLDRQGNSTRQLATVGVPTTLLLDREGRELGRISGPAEWDSSSIAEFLKSVVLGPSATAISADAASTIDAKKDESRGMLSRVSVWLKSLLGM
jgi:thiol-disulfide isomerase/thioredoxin